MEVQQEGEEGRLYRIMLLYYPFELVPRRRVGLGMMLSSRFGGKRRRVDGMGSGRRDGSQGVRRASFPIITHHPPHMLSTSITIIASHRKPLLLQCR